MNKTRTPTMGNPSSQWTDRVNLLRYYVRAARLVWHCDPKGTVMYIVGTVFLGLVAPAELWLSQLVIDTVVGGFRAVTPDKAAVLKHVLWLLSAQVLLGLAAAAVQRYVRTLQNIQGMKLNYMVQQLGLKKVCSLDVAFFESPQFHDMYQRAVDRPAMDAQGTLMHLASLVQAATTFVSMAVILMRLHPLAVPCAVLVSLPIAYFRSRFAARRASLRWFRAPSLRMANYIATLLGARESVAEIRLYSLSELLLGRLCRLWQQFVTENASVFVAERRMQLLLDTPVALVVATVGLYAMWRAINGDLTIGEMVLYLAAAKALTTSLDGLFTIVSGVYESSLSLRELFVFTDMKPCAVEGALRRTPEAVPLLIRSGLPGSIEFCNVSFRYPGCADCVLQNVSFTLSPGERIAIVGPNGAGKTTLVKLLTRFYDPTEGKILLDGHGLEEYDLQDLRRLYGVLFQDFVKYHFSARDNVGFGRIEELTDKGRLERAARNAGCLSMIQRLPQGFDTILGRTLAEGVDLSGGEWQKLALARAFMRNAEIVILDEPSGALDAIAEARLNRDIEELVIGKTCIVITHRLSMVRSMSRILVIHKGRLVQHGTHEELRATKGIYSRMYNLQASRYRDHADLLVKEWN